MLNILLVFLAFTSHAAEINLEGLEPKMDAFVNAFQPVADTGIAVGVVKDGRLVFFKGYGYRDREKKLPVTENTVFAIGSATKSFVSTSLAMLQEEGKVSFEEPLRSYLPHFSLESPEATEQATLNDLLSHQTGLPRHDFLWYIPPFSTPELFRKLSYLEMNKKPGMGFRSGKMQYNNLMFMTAGLVLEEKAGQSWPDFVRTRILQPLGMKETSFALSGFSEASAPAFGYAKEELMPYKSLENVSAAGSMNSTVADLVRWVSFHLDGGKPLMSGESLSRLYEPRSSISESGIEINYGLGMMLNTVAGKTVVWHGGNIDGFSAHVSFVPEAGVGLIVLVNQNGAGNFQFPIKVEIGEGKAPIPLFTHVIYEHLLTGAGPQPNPEPKLESVMASLDLPGIERSLVEQPIFRQAMLADTKKFTGKFSEIAYGNLSVLESEQGDLVVDYYGTKFSLLPTDRANVFDLFFRGQKAEMTAEFEFTDGKMTALIIPLEKAVRPIRFRILD